jgi:hypothetical protein
LIKGTVFKISVSLKLSRNIGESINTILLASINSDSFRLSES